jgi:hypothetical protein
VLCCPLAGQCGCCKISYLSQTYCASAALLCSALLRRNPASFKGSRHYETNGWFYVADSIMNLARNRYVITMPLMGLPVRLLLAAWLQSCVQLRQLPLTQQGIIVAADTVHTAEAVATCADSSPADIVAQLLVSPAAVYFVQNPCKPVPAACASTVDRQSLHAPCDPQPQPPLNPLPRNPLLHRRPGP